MTASQVIKRGELARRSGCNLETIRYYENIGLLQPPERTASGHRLYTPGDQARLGFILRGRDLGGMVHQKRDVEGSAMGVSWPCRLPMPPKAMLSE